MVEKAIDVVPLTTLQKLLTLRLLEPTELPSFRVKIPDVEIEFHSPDVAMVHKRFDEVMAYLKEVMNGKVTEKDILHRDERREQNRRNR